MRTPLSASSILLRIFAIVVAVGTLTAFIWYSQVNAQRSSPVVVPEQSPVVISGSKSFSGPVVKISPTMMAGSKSGILAPMPAPVSISLAPPPPQIPANPPASSVEVPPPPAINIPAARVVPITPQTPGAEPLPAPQKKRLLMPGSKAPARLLPERDDVVQRSPSPQAQSAPPANNQKSKP